MISPQYSCHPDSAPPDARAHSAKKRQYVPLINIVDVLVVAGHLCRGQIAKSIAWEAEKSETLESVEGGDGDVGDPAVVQVERVEVCDRGEGAWGEGLRGQ